MNSQAPIIAVAGLFALGLGLGTFHLLNQKTEPGKTAAGALLTIPLMDLHNQPKTLGNYQGKVLVVNFWATWCPPCREEIPHFVEAQEELKAKGVQFAGIALDKPDSVNEFMNYYRINYPIFVADENVGQIMQDIGNRTRSLPYTLIYDKQGQLREKVMGGIDKTRLQHLLAPLI
ncbi:MAG: TlpA family protein disulfide reductase [Hydrogenophilaceae bacterium]|nr:TlpA family protein disulfide reductase [Hydrogenophilaceae bacterium]